MLAMKSVHRSLMSRTDPPSSPAQRPRRRLRHLYSIGIKNVHVASCASEDGDASYHYSLHWWEPSASAWRHYYTSEAVRASFLVQATTNGWACSSPTSEADCR